MMIINLQTQFCVQLKMEELIEKLDSLLNAQLKFI
jgi:hypothetical protein